MKRKILFSIAFIITGLLCFYLGTKINLVPRDKITTEKIGSNETLLGLNFSDKYRDLMLEGIKENLKYYKEIRSVNIDNSIPPAIQFNPIPVKAKFDRTGPKFVLSRSRNLKLPENKEELAFYSVRDLAELIQTRKITSTELTKIYIARLKKYDPKLKCIITLTEDLALSQAKKADEEIASGRYRGPLHGIPFGAKDLFAVKGYKTTWGAMPYKDQVLDKNATVIKKLEDAGAVLVAKLTMGALAWGDVWYGGRTNNPWNVQEGSSGSSAGSAAATSAGLVAFAIGTETYGSIISPSTRCGTTGLRPTYGRISRTGAMALSWTMDKIGTIGRSVEDTAIVFNAIYGPDGIDQTIIDIPFNYSPDIDPTKIKIGYLKAKFDKDYPNKANDNKTLEKLKELGFTLLPIELPRYPVEPLSIILSAEAAAAFDELTRSGRVDLMVRQEKNAWPNVFRHSRFIPAVEYIQANRVRHILIQEMDKMLEDIDLYISPTYGGYNLLLTNLTGHPSVVLPNGFTEKGTPASITFIGKLFDEGTLLAVAKKYQDSTDFHLKHPPAFKIAK